METESLLISLLVVILLLLVFNEQIYNGIKNVKGRLKSYCGQLKKDMAPPAPTPPPTPTPPAPEKSGDDKRENLSSDWMQQGSVLDFLGLYENPDYPVDGVGVRDFTVSKNPLAKTWHDYIQETELDPSVHDNHRQFTKDISRFYTGAHFTEVADDNRTFQSVNFVGLRRPKHVYIGADARQQPDIDTNVLKRNRRFLL